jgi:long-chain acyl-CoA synthetase
MISHGALVSTGRNFLQVERLDERDEVMAYLPMAWIGDSFFSLAVAFLAGCTVNCPEDASTVRHDFREIGPTMTFAPPRIWENILSQAQVRIEDANWVQHRLTKFFLPRGMRKAKLELEGKPCPRGSACCCAPVAAWSRGPRPAGFHTRCAHGVKAGGPRGRNVQFRAIGINPATLQRHRCCAPATCRDGRVKLETVRAPSRRRSRSQSGASAHHPRASSG